MTVSPRELRLALATLVVGLLGLSSLVWSRQLQRLREIRQDTAQMQLQQIRNQRELFRRPELLQQLERVRAQLPSHPAGQDVRSDLSRQLQRLAQQSGLRLTGLTPEAEEELPGIGLNQLAIRCTWTGTPEALVGFLVRMQLEGPVMDIRELRARASTRPGESLSGSFIVECAFTREPAQTAAVPLSGESE